MLNGLIYALLQLALGLARVVAHFRQGFLVRHPYVYDLPCTYDYLVLLCNRNYKGSKRKNFLCDYFAMLQFCANGQMCWAFAD